MGEESGGAFGKCKCACFVLHHHRGSTALLGYEIAVCHTIVGHMPLYVEFLASIAFVFDHSPVAFTFILAFLNFILIVVRFIDEVTALVSLRPLGQGQRSQAQVRGLNFLSQSYR